MFFFFICVCTPAHIPLDMVVVLVPEFQAPNSYVLCQHRYNKLRQKLVSFRKTSQIGASLSLASFLHNFFLQLSLLCLSVKMCICVIGLGSHSWSVVFRNWGQFFLILMSNGHAQLPPNAHTTTIYLITVPCTICFIFSITY